MELIYQKKLIKLVKMLNKISDKHNYFKELLEKYQFVLIVGKYDHHLGPRALYSSVPLKDEVFVRDLLEDALNTNNKYVNLEFGQFYSQVCKIEVEDLHARGGNQLYALIFLRDIAYPQIPIIHFQRFEMMFRTLGDETILSDNREAFKKLYNQIYEVNLKKDLLSPLEDCSIKVRSGVNTIIGFADIILERAKQGNLSDQSLMKYTEMIRDSGKEILKAIESLFSD